MVSLKPSWLVSQMSILCYSRSLSLGFEHNWDLASTYPVQLMQAAGSVFDGVAFHCYGVSQIDSGVNVH